MVAGMFLCIVFPIIVFCIFIKVCSFYEFIPKNLQPDPPERIKFLDMAGNIAKSYNKKMKL